VKATGREQDDPLWLGIFFLAGLSAVAFVVWHLQTHRPPLESQSDFLFFLPLMAVGMARRVRREGGNVTQRAQQILSRQPNNQPRRYSRTFAVFLLLAYPFAVLVAVASYGLAAGVLVFTVLQGVITVFVLVHTSWADVVIPSDAESR
jgi:hypothetical protein